MELNYILKALKEDGLKETSINGLEIADSQGWIGTAKWSGKLISDSGDITHLSNRELIKLDEFLQNGKDVETDEIKKLKQEAHICSLEYSKMIGPNKGWLLKLKSTETASPRLGKELVNIGITRPDHHQAHHIVPFNQGKMAPILQKYGISVDSAANGVFLPEIANKNWPGQVTHSFYDNDNMFRHGGNYIKYLKDRLNTIEESLFICAKRKRAYILDLLEETRTYLLTGELDFLYQDKQSVFKTES
ncbi:AHH domain-containing protein [Peribacillus butanolivorans]|uniref:AHH domain-containing protein n=1 Tax=Peribacillus butanolivorans TaxID=421767 RepID=UPI0035DC2CB1